METNKLSYRIKGMAWIFMLFAMVSCSTISSFNQYAYTQSTSLKVDALNIMDLATDDYFSHKEAVKEFQTKLQKAYEYEKNRPKNEITIQLWDKLLDKNGHLLGGFINRWADKGKLGETFITETKKQVDKAFDQISGLESKKLKLSDISK